MNEDSDLLGAGRCKRQPSSSAAITSLLLHQRLVTYSIVSKWIFLVPGFWLRDMFGT